MCAGRRLVRAHNTSSDGRRIGHPEERPLVCLQYAKLGLIDRRPVIIEDAARVTRIRIPGPVRVIETICLQVRDQRALPDAFDVASD